MNEPKTSQWINPLILTPVDEELVEETLEVSSRDSKVAGSINNTLIKRANELQEKLLTANQERHELIAENTKLKKEAKNQQISFEISLATRDVSIRHSGEKLFKLKAENFKLTEDLNYCNTHRENLKKEKDRALLEVSDLNCKVSDSEDKIKGLGRSLQNCKGWHQLSKTEADDLRDANKKYEEVHKEQEEVISDLRVRLQHRRDSHTNLERDLSEFKKIAEDAGKEIKALKAVVELGPDDYYGSVSDTLQSYNDQDLSFVAARDRLNSIIKAVTANTPIKALLVDEILEACATDTSGTSRFLAASSCLTLIIREWKTLTGLVESLAKTVDAEEGYDALENAIDFLVTSEKRLLKENLELSRLTSKIEVERDHVKRNLSDSVIISDERRIEVERLTQDLEECESAYEILKQGEGDSYKRAQVAQAKLNGLTEKHEKHLNLHRFMVKSVKQVELVQRAAIQAVTDYDQKNPFSWLQGLELFEMFKKRMEKVNVN